MVCAQCFLVQTTENVPADEIFNADYAYLSSFSTSWLEHAKRYAEMMTERFELSTDSTVVEVASNDGYLLQYFAGKGISGARRGAGSQCGQDRGKPRRARQR